MLSYVIYIINDDDDNNKYLNTFFRCCLILFVQIRKGSHDNQAMSFSLGGMILVWKLYDTN